MATMYFDIVRRANSTAYSLGDLVAPATLNDHVYKCTVAGTSDGSPPSWNTGTGSTTSDGTITWTECNPTGITYAAVMAFTRNPRYGDYVQTKKFFQPIDWSDGGSLYCYDKAIAPKNLRTLRFDNMAIANLASLLNFITIVNGAQYAFNFYDEDGSAHLCRIISSSEISAYEASTAHVAGLELELLYV